MISMEVASNQPARHAPLKHRDHSLIYDTPTHQETILMKVGDSIMPALASTMEERASVRKSVDTTSSSV